MTLSGGDTFGIAVPFFRAFQVFRYLLVECFIVYLRRNRDHWAPFARMHREQQSLATGKAAFIFEVMRFHVAGRSARKLTGF